MEITIAQPASSSRGAASSLPFGMAGRPDGPCCRYRNSPDLRICARWSRSLLPKGGACAPFALYPERSVREFRHRDGRVVCTRACRSDEAPTSLTVSGQRTRHTRSDGRTPRCPSSGTRAFRIRAGSGTMTSPSTRSASSRPSTESGGYPRVRVAEVIRSWKTSDLLCRSLVSEGSRGIKTRLSSLLD